MDHWPWNFFETCLNVQSFAEDEGDIGVELGLSQRTICYFPMLYVSSQEPQDLKDSLMPSSQLISDHLYNFSLN